MKKVSKFPKLRRFTVDDIMAFHPCWRRSSVQRMFDKAGRNTCTLLDVATLANEARDDYAERMTVRNLRLNTGLEWLVNKMCNQHSTRYVGGCYTTVQTGEPLVGSFNYDTDGIDSWNWMSGDKIPLLIRALKRRTGKRA